MAYLAVGLVTALIFIDNSMTGLFAVLDASAVMFSVARYFLIGIVVGIAIIFFIVGRQELQRRIALVGYAALATVCLQAGFTLLKNTMPYIHPYFADPFWAYWDRVLHFGADPWFLAHWVGQYLPVDYLMQLYMAAWALPAIGLPIIIAASDGNHTRAMRTLVLYVVAWVFLGNILAFAGLSVGPVYYDRLTGDARFSDLTQALVASGVTESSIGRLQEVLWKIYIGQRAGMGSGISAFPSVHVAIATVTAIYMAERSKWLILPAALFLFFTFFLSVYTGYHYAIDGYASILVIFSIWLVLRRKMSPQ